MKTTLKTFLILMIFQIHSFGQTFEFCKTIGGNLFSKISSLPDESGYLAISDESSIVKLERNGMIKWKYEPLLNFPDFTRVVNLNYRRMSNGSIVIAFGNFECDICNGAAITMIDENGNELWFKDLRIHPGQCESPFFLETSDTGNLVGFGRKMFWEINPDTGELLKVKNYDSEFDFGFFIWSNDNYIYLLEKDKLFWLNEEGTKIDSLSGYAGFQKAIPVDSSKSVILLKNELVFIENFRALSHSISYVDPIKLSDVFVKDGEFYITGKNGGEHLLIYTNEDCSIDFTKIWGTDAISVTGIGGVGNQNIVAGTEKGPFDQNIPFVKSFNDIDFTNSHSELPKYDALLMGIEADSAFGRIETHFSPDSTVSFNHARWTIKRIRVGVLNIGFENISEVTINTQGPFSNGCEAKPTYISRKFVVDLGPRESTVLVWGDMTESEMFTDDLPSDVDLCFWVSSPNEQLDLDNSNDLSCNSIPIRDMTSVKKLLSSGSLEIYPNPTSAFLNLKFTGQLPANAQIQIFDTYGKRVFYKEVEKWEFRNNLNISELCPGIYFLQIKTKEGLLVKKLFKN